jgi:hypothetical protein
MFDCSVHIACMLSALFDHLFLELSVLCVYRQWSAGRPTAKYIQ